MAGWHVDTHSKRPSPCSQPAAMLRSALLVAQNRHRARNLEPPPTDNRTGNPCSQPCYRFWRPKICSHRAFFFFGRTGDEPRTAVSRCKILVLAALIRALARHAETLRERFRSSLAKFQSITLRTFLSHPVPAIRGPSQSFARSCSGERNAYRARCGIVRHRRCPNPRMPRSTPSAYSQRDTQVTVKVANLAARTSTLR